MLTDDDLTRLERMSEAAQSPPWRSFVEGRDHTSGSNVIITGADGSRGADLEVSGATIADQDFIAEARNAVPLLIREVRALRARLSDREAFAPGLGDKIAEYEIAYLTRIQVDIAIWVFQAWEAGRLSAMYNFYPLFEKLARAIDSRIFKGPLDWGAVHEIYRILADTIGKENCEQLFDRAERDLTAYYGDFDFRKFRYEDRWGYDAPEGGET